MSNWDLKFSSMTNYQTSIDSNLEINNLKLHISHNNKQYTYDNIILSKNKKLEIFNKFEEIMNKIN